MDQPSPSTDPRDRAVSSEPCSTRPNPFDDTDLSTRKRRRTSLTTSSPSRSVDALGSPQRLLGPSESEPVQEVGMKLENGTNPQPARPQTPEQRSEPHDPAIAPATSSRVTVSIRNSARHLAAASASPESPSRGTIAGEDTRNLENMQAINKQSPGPSGPDGPRQATSSPPNTASPPIEIIPPQTNDDSDVDVDEPRFLVIGDADDPTEKFPYRAPGETYADSVNRVSQYFFNGSDQIRFFLKLCPC
jgi:ubiquitin carboxyl-terminal hydrolase 34